jgi:hypothetical protein
MNGQTNLNCLIYKDSTINTKVSLNFLYENFEKIINQETFQKYFTEGDVQKLNNLVPRSGISNVITTIRKLFDQKSKMGLVNPFETFKQMLKNNYFTVDYQTQLERFKLEALENYIDKYERNYDHLLTNKTSYKEILNNSFIENDCEVTCGVMSLPLPLPKIEDYTISSGYTSVSEDEREEMIDNNYESDKNIGLELESSLSDERFKNLKMSKNQLTIRPRSKDEIESYQKSELERYKNPHLPWVYNDIEGKPTVVAPVLKKILTGNSNKPRDHVLLKSDRPSYVTILCLARDAASRLPDGVGTRSDICDLLKDSQYVIERLSDTHVNYI